MKLFVGTLASLLSIAFFAVVAILQPGLFGTLGLFVLACAIFLVGISIRCLIGILFSFRADKNPESSDGSQPKRV
jgi:hypothetical protein